MAADGRCRWWVLGGSILGAALLGVVRAQDNTEPTAEELACWNQYNGGAYYNAATTTCEACATGRYDHDAIINMPHMNMNMNMEVTWWDALTSTDYNPAATECIDCEQGKFAPFEETTHMCYPCGEGQFSEAGATACTVCTAGRADHDSDASTPCIPCAAGTFSRGESQSCRDCLAGFVDEDESPDTPCSACSAGFFSAGSDDAEYDGTNPEVYAIECLICEAGTADLDGQYDNDVDGHCAVGTDYDPHHPGDYVPVDTQEDCHGVCSLPIPLPTHYHTEEECLALGDCFDGTTGEPLPGFTSQEECEGIRPIPGTWVSAGAVWTASTLAGADENRWHSPFCGMEDGTFMDVAQVDCVEGAGAGSGLYWHEEVFYSASTPCVSCVPGRYQTLGQITCIQCEPGFTTDSLVSSGGTTCTPVPPGFYDHDSVANGDADGYCRDLDGEYVYLHSEGACLFTGHTWNADTSVCTSSQDGQPIDGVATEAECQETGYTWNADEIFYSSTTPPRECEDGSTTDLRCVEAAPMSGGASVEADAIACAAVDVTAATAAVDCETAANGACAYTREGGQGLECTPAPAGHYDHDLLSTTAPLECPNGYTTDLLAETGATSCTPAPLGLYDHDALSTTVPIECGHGFTTGCVAGFTGDPEAVESCVEVAATCVETASTSVPADAANCAAVTGLGLATSTACDAVMLGADGTTPACTYTSVIADAAACAAVDLDADSARADCQGVMTAADENVKACVYTPPAAQATCVDWVVGDVAATGCSAVARGYYDHDNLPYTLALQCPPGNMVGGCIRAECRDSGGALVTMLGTEALVDTAEACSADSGNNVFDQNAITSCLNTNYFKATTCTPVPIGSYDDDESSITPPVPCLKGSTTDTLDQPGAALCEPVPAGFYDSDSGDDGAPFCTDVNGDFLFADADAIRPTELYCEVSGSMVTIVNPSEVDVTVGEIQISSAVGLANPTGAYVGNFAQQEAQGDPFTLHSAVEYTQYLDYNFYETALVYKLQGGSQTFQMGLDYPVGPLHDSTGDIVCLAIAPDGTESQLPTFEVTPMEAQCVAVAGNEWSRHEAFQSSTTAPEQCPPGSTTDTELEAGAISCTEAPAGEFDHDSACHEVTGYCKDDYSSCVDVDAQAYCSQTWQVNPYDPALESWCMEGNGASASDENLHASQAACETVYSCDGTVASDASVEYADVIGDSCQELYADPSSPVALNNCQVSGCTRTAAVTGNQYVATGCYQGTVLQTPEEICNALAGHTWMPSDTFFSSTTPPRHCAASREARFLGAQVGGSTTYTEEGFQNGQPAGSSTGATRCEPAPPGEYDHDIDPTTGPIECSSGYTTDTRAEPGAIACEPAKIGFYDHDLSSTTIPVLCEIGSNTFLPDGVAAVLSEGATICARAPPGLYDHDSANDQTYRGVEGAAGWGYCSEADGTLTAHAAELACTVTSASCTGTTDTNTDCATAFSVAIDDTANSCPNGCDYVPQGDTGRLWHPETRFYSSTTLPVECAAGSETTHEDASDIDGATGCTSVSAGLYDHDSANHGVSHSSDATCTGSYRDFTHGVGIHGFPDELSCEEAFAGAGDGLAASCPAECDYGTEHYCISPVTFDLTSCSSGGSCGYAIFPEYTDESSNTDASCTGVASTPTCADYSSTEGCPFGCIDDGTTCSGYADTPVCDLSPLTDGRADCPAGCTFVTASGCTAGAGQCYAANGVDGFSDATDEMSCTIEPTGHRWTPDACTGTTNGGDACDAAFAGTTSEASPAQGGQCDVNALGQQTGCTFVAGSCSDGISFDEFSCELQLTDRQWATFQWVTGVFYSSITPPIECPAGSTTDTLTAPGATACTAAPPGKYDQDLDATTAPLECGHGAPVVCTANFDGTGGVVPCDETRCTRTGNLWSAADLTCRTELGALRGVATCTGTATNTADTPDCALAFATAGDGLPDSCADGCTYREPFDQNACVYTGHVWDAGTGTCSDVSGRGYCLDADGDRMVESMSTHDWRDPDLCESVSGRTWVWQQFRGYQTDTLENGGATQCIMCPSGAADTDRTSTTACSTCDPGETTMRCTDASGVVTAAVSEEECTAAPSCGDFTVAEGCPPGCGDDGTDCTGDADTPSTTWQAQGATSCLLCPEGNYDDDDDPSTVCIECADGGTTYTLDSSGEPTELAAGGATRCILAPAGEYDHDGVATTAPLECGDGSTDDDSNAAGFTTNTLGEVGATECIPAPAGTYDHDSRSTTEPLECGDGVVHDNSNQAGYATNALARCIASEECDVVPGTDEEEAVESTTCSLVVGLGCTVSTGQGSCNYVITDVHVTLGDGSVALGLLTGNTYDSDAEVGERCLTAGGDTVNVATEARCLVDPILSEAQCETQSTGRTWSACTDANGVVDAATLEECEQTGNSWDAGTGQCTDTSGAVMVESCAGTASGDDTGMTCDLDSATDDIATCPSGCDHYQPPADDVTCTTTGNSFGSEPYCYASDGSTTISDLDEATCEVEPSTYTWRLEVGATECTACAQGFADVDGISVTACEACPVGTTTERQNEDGTSSIAIAATVCIPCSDGSYDHDMTATTPCFECNAGKYGQGADDECGDCPSGLYDDDRSSTTPCVTCALGQHSNPGQTYCDDCPRGEHDHDMNPATPCIDCAEGQFAPQRSVECVDCEAGYADADESAATECEMCRPGQYSAQRGVTCASCEKGQTDLDGQATQDLYLSGAGSLPLVAGSCIDVDSYSLLADITDEGTCVGDAESPTGRTWTSPTPQCLTHFVPGTCTRPSGNTWTEPNGPCLDGNEQEVIDTRPGETLTARQLEAMCTRTAVPIFDEAGCTSLVQDATWSVYEYCAQAQTSPDEITEDMRNADHTSCESQSTGNTFVAGSCTDTSGGTTSHSTEDSCVYEPTSNMWDPSAAAGDECSDSNGNVLPVQPGDESACVQEESGRMWSPGQCFAPDSSLLADLTTQSDCLYTSTGNTWFPGICMRNDMVTWMEALIDGILVDVLDEAMCDQMQAECTAITDPWYRVGAYLAERADMCRTGAIVQGLASVQPFALDTCNSAAEYASTHSVTLQAACTAMADVITAAVDADPSHPCANAAAACACVFTPQEVPSAGTPCVQCASGRYTDRLFFGECDECDAGRYDEDADPSTPCEDCFVGRYSSAGQVECIDCAGGTYDHDQNPATTCLDCQVGYHSAPIVHKVCTTASGDIWDISHIEDPVESDCINDLRPDNVWSVYVTGAFGPNGCIGCDFGTADEDMDPATACNQCRPGQFAPQLATGCTDCPQGYGDDDLDPSTPCVQCRVGMFAPAGATNCTGCPQGKHDGDLESTTPCEDCLAGQYSGSGWTNCTNCTAGFADEDQNPATPCDACAPGQYTPEFSIICVDCLAFEYDNDSNPATPCVLCDEGHHTNGLACISCAAGLFDDDADPGTECESCMIGQYSPVEAVSCTDCAAGAHDHDRDPSTACELCGPGNFSALGDLFCFPCRPGTHDNDTDASTPCVSCPSGTFSEVGATECIDCAAGRIDRDFDPASPCVACPPGSYAGEGATVCTTCAAGQIDHDQDPATDCSTCEPGKHSAFGDYKCDACFTGYYDADGSAATPCTRCEAGQFSSGLGRCSAGSTDLFTYFQWSRPLPQTEGECTTVSNSNIWSSSFRCVDTDGLTTLPEVADQSACTGVAGRVWTSGCFSSDGSFVSARITRHECTTDPTGNLWVVAFPGLCDADTNPVDECSSEVTTDTGITQECFDAITESPSAAAFVETLDGCTACESIDGPADICSACEADVQAALARCTPTGAAEHSICVIPTISEYETCELKSSNNVWFPPVCRTAPTTNTWGGDPPICTDDQNSQTAATSEAECVGNAPVISLDETECEIEATGRTWIDGWCNDYARCIDTDGSIVAEFTAESECVIDSTGNTWNPADVLPTGVADINADADTVTFAISQTSLVIGQALQLGHNVPTCDLSAATDGTGDCPAGCLFIDTTTPVCQWEDADALTGCPVGCVEDLNQGTCTGDATPVPATCTGQADAKNCAATVGVDLVISNLQGAQVTFATDILAGDPDALQNCHISRKLCTSDSGLVAEADDQDECELADSGRSWITPRVAGVTDETTCEWEATGYTWDAVGTCHLLCAYSQGTEGCPEGCTDDGTTCSGETDALHSTIASEAECGGSCVMTPGTSEEEANEATTCTLIIGDCTVATGSGSCAYATSTETVWRTGQCWEGASTVSATNEADCETVRISPARTWVEPYCNDADGNQLSSSAAGTEQVCELAASGNVWSEGYCEAPVESLNPASVGLSVAEIDDTTNTVTLASVESGISVGDVLHMSSAPGQSCQALPLNTDLIVGSVDGAIITFEEATFASADGEVTAGDVGAGNNCIIVRPLFSDQGACEEMPTGNTWWYPYTYCDNCPSGSFDDDMDPTTPCLACIAGEYSPGRTNSCIDCEPGFADADSNPGTVCAACHTGQYSGDRATVCWDCQAGEKDADSDPSTPCVACNAGQFAAVASTTCATCDAGQADLDSDPATACASCPAGRFAASGSTSCTVCSTGQVDHDSDASTACESCVVGEYSAPGETACSICAAGTHDDDSDPGTPCVACPPGTETLAEGRCLDASQVVTALNAGADDEERCESVRNTNTWTPAECTQNSDSSPVVAADEDDCTIDITGAHFFSASFCTLRDGTIVDRAEAACVAAEDSFWTAAGCGDAREVVEAIGTCEHVESTDVCPCEKRDSGASWAAAFCAHGTTGAVLVDYQDVTACEMQATSNEWRAGYCSNNADNSLVADVTAESVCEVESTGRFWDGMGVCIDVNDPNQYYNDRSQSVCQVASDSNWLEGRCWAALQQTVSGINPGAQTVTTANAETSVVAGVKLQLADAPGQSCLATPLDTDLEVESRVGSTITFVPGSITAGDAASAANCVLREPVTAANQPDCEENPLPRTWTDPGCYDASGVSLAGTVENNDIGSCTTESSGHIWNEGVCTKSDLSLDTEATDEYSCLVEVTDNMEFSAAFCTLTDGTQSERTRSDCETATDSVWTYAGCSDARSPIDNDEATCYQQDRPNTWHPASCEDENLAPVTPTPESEVLCERDPTGNSWQPVGSYCADCVAGRADIDSDGGAETYCDVCPSGTYAPVRSTVCEPCPSGTYDTETACTSNTGAVVVAETEAECLGSCTVLPGTAEEEAAEETTCELSVSSCAVATGSGSCEYVASSNTWFLTASTPCVACAIGRVAVDAVTNCDACADGLADVDSVYGGLQPYCLDATGQYADLSDPDLCEIEATGHTWVPAGCVDMDGAVVPAASGEAFCELTGNTWDGATCASADGAPVDAVDYDECTLTGNSWHSARCVSDPSLTSEAECEMQATGRTWVSDARCIDTDGSTVATSFIDQLSCEQTGNVWDTLQQIYCTNPSGTEVAADDRAACEDTGRTWTDPSCIRADGTPLTAEELCVLLPSHSWIDSLPFYSASTPCVQCLAGQVSTESCVDVDGVTVVPADDQADCETSETGNEWDGTICTDELGVPAVGSDQESCELEASGRYWGATGCSECLAGTADTDSDPATACEVCVPGRYAAANSVTCEECAPGRSSSDPTVPCAECSAGEYTAAGATVCTACDTGFEDDDSDPSTACTDVNECLAMPCQNGATCSDSSSNEGVAAGEFECDCAPGFTGVLCETDNGDPVIAESEVSCNDITTPVDFQSPTAAVEIGVNSITIGTETVTIDFTDNVMAATCTDPGTVCAGSTTGTCPDGCIDTGNACTGTATCELGVGGQAVDCPTAAGCVYVAAPAVSYVLTSGGGPVDASSAFEVSTSTTVVAVVTDGTGNEGTCDFVVTVVDNEDPDISPLPPASISADADAGQGYATNGVGAFLPSLSATDHQSTPTTDVPPVVQYVGACETSDGSPLAGNDEIACTSETSTVSTGYIWEPGACAYTNDPGHPATPEGGAAECVARDDMFWTVARCLDGETLIDADTEEECTTQESNNVWRPLASEVDDNTQFTIGQTVVTFVARDRADSLEGVDAPNTFQATTVVDVVDNQSPTIPVGRCVDVTVGTDPGKDFATVAVALDGGVDIVPDRFGDDNSGESLPLVATLGGDVVNANRWDGTACIDLTGAAVEGASEAECATQFVLGVNTVTYTATDAAGNSGTCTFDVTVEDLEVPTIDSATCADISATTDLGEAYGSTAFDVPTDYPGLVATDNSVAAGDLVVKSFVERCVAGVAALADCQAIADGFTWNNAAGTCTEDATSNEVDASFCYHSEALQWSTTSGRLSTGTQGVCLQLAHTNQGTCESDSNLPSPSWEWVEVTALTRFPIGDTDLAIVVADGTNVANTISGPDACVITLTIADDEAPTISCGSDPTGTTDPGESFATIGAGSLSLPATTAVDNDVATVAYETAPTCSDPPCAGHLCQQDDCNNIWYPGGDEISDDYQFPHGMDATTVVFVATDGAGNEDRCSITVNVNDNEAPSIECPAAITIEADVADSWVSECGAGGANCVSGQEPGSARIYGLAELPELASISDNSGEIDGLAVTVGTSATDGVTALGAETSGGSGVYSLPAQFEFDVFVDGDDRTAGATRAYIMEYSATDSSGNAVTCTTVVTVAERDDCQDNPCHNNGHCTDLIADSFGYFEDGESRLQYDTEHHDGTIVRVGSEEIVAFSEWAAHVAANGAESLGANIDPGYQCSCVRGWEGETCEQDVNECGAYECLNTANAPCSGPCENGAICTESTTDSSIAINSYSCGCMGGFTGSNCQTLDECNPPGGPTPCELSSVALPNAGPHNIGLLPTDRRFLCPVTMVCTDPDHDTTDDYTCSCPSCNDAVFSESEVEELQVFFEEHLTYRRSIATLVARQGDPNEVCAVPDLNGCTDPAAVNFDAAAAIDDGSCVTAVEGCMDEAALNYDSSATVYSFATHSDSALQCKQTDIAINECDDDPCNLPEHRLCQHEVGRPGDEPGEGCLNSRQSFHCDARFAGSGTQRFEEEFSCTDPNPYWAGDYICTCEYDTEDGDYIDTYVHAATCGVDDLQTEAVENVLFDNPYRPMADVPPKLDSPVCIGTADNAFTGCVYTAARPEHGKPETCIAQGFTDFGCVLTPGVDCSINPDTGLPNGCRYIEEVAAVAEACVTSTAVVGMITAADSTRCVLTGTVDSGVTPGSCADVDSSLATCEYVPGTYDGAGTEITPDSCSSTLLSVAECGLEQMAGDDDDADQSACQSVVVAGLANPCTYVAEVLPVPEQCTAPTYCDGSFTEGDRESCEGKLCADLFLDILNAPGATLADAQLACTASGCDYFDDECASLGKKMCPGDGACVDAEFLCVITNYDLTQLVKEDDEMFSFIMTRQRRPIHERVPTADELAQWCPTDYAACNADATCASEILVLLATPPTQAAIDSAGSLAQALANCAIAVVEAEYGALGDWANSGR